MQTVVRKGLTKAKILGESQALVDAGGPAALTMRALAAKLGVAPMALYNHFQDRDDILDAMADSVFEQLRKSAMEAGAQTRRAKNWRHRVRTLVMNAHQLAVLHPHIFRTAMSRPNKPASAFALASDTIRVLEEAGLKKTQAFTVYHSFVMLLLGYPFWQEGIAAANGMPADTCLPTGLLAQGWTAERQFEAIVDWLLAAVADLCAKKPSTSRLASRG